MKYRLFLTLAAVPLAGTVLAQASPRPDEHVDLLFLRGPRPVLLRLHVRVDGLPYHSPWSNYLHELFAVLDRDRDGVLNMAEAGRAPKGQTLAQQARGGGLGFFGQQGSLATFQEMAADPDSGEITFEEFAAYYYKSGFRPLVVSFGQGGNPGLMADALTDALFKFLDQDRDGKLSQEEVGRAEAALRKLDLDDDELISVQEFLPNPFGNGVFLPQQLPANVPASQQPAFAVLDPTQPASAWLSPLVRTYDKNKNGKLDAAEVGLDPTDFDRLDANRDGELDADELAGLQALRPDAEFVLRLGKLGPNEAAADLFPAEGRPAPLAQQITKSSSGLTLTVGAAQINLARPAQPGNPQAQQVRGTLQFYLQQFRNADSGKKGYLERKDLQQNRQLLFLVNIFPLADTDEDDRLTEKEVTDWFELQTRVATAYLTLTVGDSGRGLFDLLDQNRDSRLGTRELRTAWERIRPWTRDQAPIGRTEIPGQFSLTLNQGPGGAANPVGRPFVVGSNGTVNPAVPPAARSGPVWFHKMDRNGDGDLSRREFLGTKEDFARIDANGDGLISLEEATKFDAQSRK